MKRKKLILAIGIAVFYCLLLILLVAAESAYTPSEGEETISTFPKALWYSLTTLTTVGYGDLYPHTLLGRIIGSVFLVMSVGFLVFLIGALWSRVRDHLLPKMKLSFSTDKEWFVFSQYNPESAALARNLSRETQNCLCIFAGHGTPQSVRMTDEGICVGFSIDALVQMKKGRGKTTVFYIGDNGYDNYRSALMLSGAPACCMTEYEPDRITDQITFFHPCRCCARLYWRRFPVLQEGETIALLGGGAYAAAMLEQALLLNVFSPEQHLTYYVYGDPALFSQNHPYLSDVLSLGTVDPERDSLLFLPGQWYEDAARLRNADRVIVCFDSEEETLDTLCRLERYFPVSGKVYARFSEPFENVVTFGGMDEVFTPELVLRTELDKAAKVLNEIYRSSVGGASPSWNELSAFLRRSNLASADHLEMKAQVLLGADDGRETQQERYARAYRVYLERKDRDADLFRQIEHDRWMRFHILNNWQYAPVRDNARRLHPLMLPYAQISKEEHKKDDYAWELLGTLAESK